MQFDILTILPEIMKSPLQHSIIKRAQEKGLVTINVHNIRDYATGTYKSVDDYAYSGGAGMVLSIEPIDKAIEDICRKRKYDEIIYASADGEKYTQKMANYLSTLDSIIILCGHYKGIDQRIRDHLITREISIGDYVLTGGELAAMVIMDSVIRLLPGSINDETSALTDSFQDNLLAPPVYTRPAEYKGWKVPEILLSGDQKKIEEWKLAQTLERTRRVRPDMLEEEE